MRNEVELTLKILECYLKHGLSLSIKDLCIKTKASEREIRYILQVLEKRGYLLRNKSTNEYTLSKKIAMLV